MKLMKSSLLYFAFLSFIGGVAFCSLWDFGYAFGIFWLLLSIVVWLLVKKNSAGAITKKYLLILSLVLFFFALGLLRCSLSNSRQFSYALDEVVGTEQTLVGVVTEERDERENSTQLTLTLSRIGDIALEDLDLKILLTVPHYPQFNYGDKLSFAGVLQKPENFTTENGREFDYIQYLAKDRIFYQMFYPATELLSKDNGNFIKAKLFSFKNYFLGKVEKTISEPEVSLLGGLLVGTKQSLGKQLQKDFRKVGLIHIVVLSGYNVTIIAEFIMGLLSFLPATIGMSLGSLSIILFALMVGGSATIVRASIMALLVVLARATGRVSDIARALFLAGFAMVLHNPQIVVFDPSFQLSFLATLGLIILSPKLSQYFQFIPQKLFLRETVVATLATQLFVLPFLLYMTGEFSLVAVFVNILVLMLIPLTMLFGFLTGAMSILSLGLALPLAYLTYFLLHYELKIVEFFAQLPFASVKIPHLSFALVLVIYLFYTIGFWWLSRKP